MKFDEFDLFFYLKKKSLAWKLSIINLIKNHTAIGYVERRAEKKTKGKKRRLKKKNALQKKKGA